MDRCEVYPLEVTRQGGGEGVGFRSFGMQVIPQLTDLRMHTITKALKRVVGLVAHGCLMDAANQGFLTLTAASRAL